MMRRIQMIQDLVTLTLGDDIEHEDLENYLLDYMEDNFNVEIEDNSAKEISNIIMTIKKEFRESYQERGVLESIQFSKLVEFNEK